jgi:hypothetical protein
VNYLTNKWKFDILKVWEQKLIKRDRQVLTVFRPTMK